MSDAMMGVLQRQVESLTRQVEELGPENERVRNLLTEFDQRHDRDAARIAALERVRRAARDVDLGRSIHNDRLPNGAGPLNGPAWEELRDALHAAKGAT